MSELPAIYKKGEGDHEGSLVVKGYREQMKRWLLRLWVHAIYVENYEVKGNCVNYNVLRKKDVCRQCDSLDIPRHFSARHDSGVHKLQK